MVKRAEDVSLQSRPVIARGLFSGAFGCIISASSVLQIAIKFPMSNSDGKKGIKISLNQQNPKLQLRHGNIPTYLLPNACTFARRELLSRLARKLLRF